MMNFDKLDKTMRMYETNADQCVLPGISMMTKTILENLILIEIPTTSASSAQ